MADVTFTFSGDASALNAALTEIKQEIGKTKEAVGGMAGKFAVAFTAIQAGLPQLRAHSAAWGKSPRLLQLWSRPHLPLR